MRIYLDLDETLVNLVDPWLKVLNKMSGHNHTRDVVGAYSVEEHYKDKLSEDEIFIPFNTEGFWSELPPLDGAIDFVQNLLEDAHDVYVVTVPADSPICHAEKEEWVKTWLPEIGRERLIFCHHKFLLRGDALLDDNPNYLSRFEGARLLFDRPWNDLGNLEAGGYFPGRFVRIHSYNEALSYFKQLALPF